MSFKNDMKQVMGNVVKDVEKEVDKKWNVTYEGHIIELHNRMKEEILYVDGKIIAQNKRKSIWTHIIPYVTLAGEFTTANGEQKKVTAKVGGFLNFNCTIKVDGRPILNESEKFTMFPWANKEPITPFIREQIQQYGQLQTDALPDDDYVYDVHHPKIAPGLQDQLNDEVPMPFFVNKLYKLLQATIDEPTEKTRAKLYEEVNMDTIASYGEKFIEQFPQQNLEEYAVQREAVWLLEHAADREVVKFAIVLLGCTNCEVHKQQLFEIGHHEEFTIYVAFAFTNGLSDGNELLWLLAKNITGWGRLVVIPQIEADTEDIREWFLTEANDNTISRGYSAYDCIVKGRLDEALEDDEVSKALFNDASELLRSVMSYQATTGYIEHYVQGFAVLQHYVRHAKTHCQTLEQFYILTLIENDLMDDEWQERYEAGWATLESHHQLIDEIRSMTADSKWLTAATDCLDQDFNFEAYKVAKHFGLNVVGKMFRQLPQHARNELIYTAITESGGRIDHQELCNFAMSTFNFHQLTEAEQACVEVILQDLYEFEGVGLSLLEASLQSPSITLQKAALWVLNDWPKEAWYTESMASTLTSINTPNVDKEIQHLAKKLLK